MNIQYLKKKNSDIMIYANKAIPGLLVVVLIVTFGISLSAQRTVSNFQVRTQAAELSENKEQHQADLENKKLQTRSQRQVPVFKMTKLYENNPESINAYKAKLLKQRETASAEEAIHIEHKILLLDKKMQQLASQHKVGKPLKNKNLDSSEKKVRKPRKQIVRKAFTNPVFYSND